MIKNKFSILSVDSNPDYLFFVPMTCAFWKEIGYQPVVYLVDTGIKSKMKKLIEKETEKVGGIIRPLSHIQGYRTCNVAQISRLYASSDPMFNEDDYLLTDDMDKFVIDYMWFNQQNSNKDIHIYDPDELNYKRLKIGNIGMKASVWKEIMGITQNGVRESLTQCFEESLSSSSTWEQGWNLDEWLLTKAVFDSKYYPDRCQMLERGGNKYGIRNGRIDRGAWRQTFDNCMSTRLIDVHLHREPYIGEVWEDTIKIMQKVFPSHQVESFIEYKEKFIELM